jgi:hypothetical protein
MLLVRKARSNIYPNPGFANQLRNYEKELKKLRYSENQQARFPNDYASLSK